MTNSTNRNEQLKKLSPAKRALLVKAMREEAARHGRAGTITPRHPQSSLVAIRTQGTRPPFFCVHPSGGNVLCYAPLARCLGDEQPFYGLQARGLDCTSAPHTRITDMAAQYVEELSRVCRAGPYFLGGWSMGGVVAFEMARQLRARGDQVALLAMIDSRLPPPAHELVKDDLALLMNFGQDLGLSPEELPCTREELLLLSPDEQLAALMSQAKKAQLLPPDVEIGLVRCLFEVYKSNLRALPGYAPPVYQGRVTLFRAAEQGAWSRPDEIMNWDAWASRGVETYSVPGNHYTMVREPNVRVLAEGLAHCIADAMGA
jgi:thioesterase domain-containing protein